MNVVCKLCMECECSGQEICGVNILWTFVIFLGKQYMCNPTYLWMFLDNCAWIYHLHGDCCRQTVHEVKRCECFSLFWANNSRLWMFFIVLGKQFNVVNVCECFSLFLANNSTLWTFVNVFRQLCIIIQATSSYSAKIYLHLCNCSYKISCAGM